MRAKIAKTLRIRGIVQGVGFRPYLYRLAKRYGLNGFVRNDERGVETVIEGEAAALEAFLQALSAELPPLARIDGMEVHEIPAAGYESFEILSSHSSSDKSTAVSPDIALCDACLAEMRDPCNRRFGHPFITCTDCGPRYSIIRTVPYDRPNTSMARFPMCDKCRAEYEDPASRRYHAQPIACPECGPVLQFWRKTGMEKGRWEVEDGEQGSLIEKAAKMIREGKIVAVKGLGGFHLVCDASNAEAVAALRRRKRRPSKPFAVMVKDLAMARSLAQIDAGEEALLRSKERPIVLLKKADPYLSAIVDDPIAPGIDRIGLMLPYTPLHHLFFDFLDVPLIATSANLSDEPIIREGKELREKLGGVIDAVLDHNREIVNACDDSVAQIVAGRVQWLRVARGIAPLTLQLDKTIDKPMLAVGGNQKNTLALAFESKIVLSPHIGDLGTLEAMEYFDRTVKTFERFYDFKPQIILCDLHPRYESRRWAERYKAKNPSVELHSLQHHYAHALAVMAEHNWRSKALAIVWDGTGYGSDGTIWGAEALLCDAGSFDRVASLRPFRLLGGERATREPRRVALAMLFELLSLEEVLALDSPTVAAFKPREIRLLHQAWKRGANAPLASSMGRLFDVFASLTGLCQHLGYEGESGLRLEAEATRKSMRGDAGELLTLREGQIDWEPLLKRLIRGESVSASAFIHALAESIVKIAERYPDLPVILSGGVFQNKTLLERVLPLLKNREVLLPRQVAPNDGAIALGQVWWGVSGCGASTP
ncbi:carbamoyltransferase HypF [Nitratifractor salsuginis]|uniref:Carbamoyltransferase n=1 Tax=Nitratifractor salsuginis (strain DSM 16511 / JCM 12458 / E9I37-1) TaxID=749222 RepID=E6WYA4_NITSE|nr:carbamoyltransferase HypF [Nitratifractor salsuginis]ADV45352.1 (NiFe) hydrogenase maturation protein HypF [Nitratifractor salsuginis DSM 16511]